MESKVSTNKKRKTKKPVFLVLFIIIGYLLLRMLPTLGFTSPEVVVASHGQIENIVSTRGVIIRDEVVIYSGMNGTVKYLKPEGERIPINSRVAEISQDINSESINAQLELINNKLKESDINPGIESVFRKDLDGINDSINSIMREIEANSLSRNTDKVMELRDKLEKEIQKKYVLIEKIGVGNKDKTWLINERDNLKKQLSEKTQLIDSKISGVVSYFVDGYENILIPSKIQMFTVKDFQTIKPQLSNVKIGKVLVGDPLFKVVDNYRWFISFIGDKSTIEKIQDNRRIDVRVNGEIEAIPFRVHNISKEESGLYLITLETTRYFDKFAQDRMVDMQIVITKQQGIKLPISSLVEKEGEEGVFVVDIHGMAVFKPVEVIGKDSDYIIVKEGNVYRKDSVVLYDQVIVKGNKVKENQIVDKLKIY